MLKLAWGVRGACVGRAGGVRPVLAVSEQEKDLLPRPVRVGRLQAWAAGQVASGARGVGVCVAAHAWWGGAEGGRRRF